VIPLKLKKDTKAFAQLVPLVLSVVITFAILFVGSFINGEIHQNLEDSLTYQGGGLDLLENTTSSGMNNTSANYDSALNIVQVVIIITVLASAIGAIFLFTRFQ